MDYSDPYDDDGFFDNPDALRDIEVAEAQAISASQAPGPSKPPQRYHHTVSAPRAGSSLAPFGRKKDGTPKAPAPLNVQPGSVAGGFGWEAGGKRVAEGNVARHLDAIDKRQAYWGRGKKDDEEVPMDFMVDSTGRYAHDSARQEEEDVVDNRHVPITIAASQAPPRHPPDPKSAQARRLAIAAASAKVEPAKRLFSRSISVGSHLAAPRLEPNPSQTSSQPSSQGAAARKAHYDSRGPAAIQSAAVERPLWRDEMEVDVDQDKEERKQAYNALQMRVYEAEGRAATLERNKQKDISRYAAEADKLKNNIEALQQQIQAKEREYKQQLESLKSQAVFNNHAVINSVARQRQSSQRPAPRSPVAELKGKAVKPPPPQPGFKNLVNTFSGPSRTKRQRTQEASPVKAEPRTPEASPAKPQQLAVEVFEDVPLVPVPDRRAELLHHLFSYSYLSPFREKEKFQPTLFHILNYHSGTVVDPTSEYPQACASILKACGDLDLEYEGIVQALANSWSRMLAVFENMVAHDVDKQGILAMCDVFRLLSRTAIIHPSLVESMIVGESNLGARLHRLARQICESGLEEDAKTELMSLLADVGEAVCLGGDGRAIWRSTELVDFILLFAGHARGVDVFFAASCSPTHFRALTAGKPEGGQALLDAMARSLVILPGSASTENYRASMSIVRAFSMLAVSDPNGVLLISERTVFVPCLVKVLHRESSKIWGINYDDSSLEAPLSLLYLALTLLHHLAYPSPYIKPIWSSTQGDAATAGKERLLSAKSDPEPSPDDIPQGLNIGDRLVATTQTKEFNGVHHVFQAALGAMAFAEVDLQKIEGRPKWRVSVDDMRRIQYLSQDLLEAVAEGPEVDAIYEIYAGEDEDEGVDPEVYAEMDDIQ